MVLNNLKLSEYEWANAELMLCYALLCFAQFRMFRLATRRRPRVPSSSCSCSKHSRMCASAKLTTLGSRKQKLGVLIARAGIRNAESCLQAIAEVSRMMFCLVRLTTPQHRASTPAVLLQIRRLSIPNQDWLPGTDAETCEQSLQHWVTDKSQQICGCTWSPPCPKGHIMTIVWYICL